MSDSAEKPRFRSLIAALFLPLLVLIGQIDWYPSLAHACREKGDNACTEIPKPGKPCPDPKPLPAPNSCFDTVPNVRIVSPGARLKTTKTSLFGTSITLEGMITENSPESRHTLQWYGPFGRVDGPSATVHIPHGAHTVSLLAAGCPRNSKAAHADITVFQAFYLNSKMDQKKNTVRLQWKKSAGSSHYDIYRATDTAPQAFAKIGTTSTAGTTYIDDAPPAGTIALYAVAAVDPEGREHYSDIVAVARPAAGKSRKNSPPVIYSPPQVSAISGHIYEYTVLAADADRKDTIVFKLLKAPKGMHIDRKTGRIRWMPRVPGTYQVTVAARNPRGPSGSQSFFLEVQGSTPSVALHGVPQSILQNVPGLDGAQLQWCATDAEYAVIAPDIGRVEPTGIIEVQPEQTTDYTITAYGPGGTATQSQAIAVVAAPPAPEYAPRVSPGADNEILKTSLLGGSITLEGALFPVLADETLTLEWHGPFGSVSGNAPQVPIPQGTYAVALQGVGCLANSVSAYTTIRVEPAFFPSIREKRGKLELRWPAMAGVEQFEIYRASEHDPFSFEKIATQSSSGYRDHNISKDTTYLYAVAANDSQGESQYSAVIAAAVPSRSGKYHQNRQPILYSPALTQAVPNFLYEYSVLAADVEDDELLYRLTEAPIGMIINGTTGKISWFPTEAGDYPVTVEVLDCDGLFDSQSFLITVVPPPPAVVLSADPEIITVGYPGQDSSTLSWCSMHAGYGVLEPGIGQVAPSGDTLVRPEDTTEYTITAYGPGGTAIDTAMVTVNTIFIPPPTVNILATPPSIAIGEESLLTWDSTNADGVSIDQGIGSVALGSADDPEQGRIVTPQTTTTYTITATGPGGTATASTTVMVRTGPTPSVDIVAIPNHLAEGQSSWLYWSSANADTITIDQNVGPVGANGCYGGDDNGYPGIITGECSVGREVTPPQTTTYTITATGPGGTATDSVTVSVGGEGVPPTVEIIAVPETIEGGDSSWLYWHSTNAEIVTIDQGIGPVAPAGCYGGEDQGFHREDNPLCGMGKLVTPPQTTTYTITATGPGGTATDSLTVNVTLRPPTVAIIAVPDAIEPGGTSWLLWHSTDAQHVFINRNIGAVAANGCYGGEEEFPLENGAECGSGIPVSPGHTTSYTITAIGPGGTATDSAEVTVASGPPPTVTISAAPPEILSGEVSHLKWSSEHATTVVIDQGIGVVAPYSCLDTSDPLPVMWRWMNQFLVRDCLADEFTDQPCQDEIPVFPSVTTTYTITAYGPGGTATSSVTVTVADAPPPRVIIVADGDEIAAGQISRLRWHVANAATVTIDQGIGVVLTDGCYGYGGGLGWECDSSLAVSPQSTTTYTITAEGLGGTTSDSVTVYVGEQAPAFVKMVAIPETIELGRSVWLYWNSAHADSVTIDHGIGPVAINGCYGGEDQGYPLPLVGGGSCSEGVMVTPTFTTTYTITAAGQRGDASDTVTVVVNGNGVPTAEFFAEPAHVFRGQGTTLHWRTADADNVSIDGGIGPVAVNSPAGGLPVTPDSTTTYTLRATGPGGEGTISQTVIVIEPLPPLADLVAWPETVEYGRHTVLAWSSTDADAVSITADNDESIGAVALNSGTEGLRRIPKTTTTYTMTASGSGGSVTDAVTVKVLPAISVSATPHRIQAGDPSVLSITTINGDQVTINQGIGTVDLIVGEQYRHFGAVTVNPVENTTYTITATGTGGTSVATVTIIVEPKVSFEAERTPIRFGEAAVLNWSTVAADTLSFQPDIGTDALNSGPGGFEVFPLETTTYTLTAAGPGGETSRTLTVEVEVVLDLQAGELNVDTSRCYEYIELGLRVDNIGEARIPAGLPVVFYNGDPAVGGTLIATRSTTTDLQLLSGSERLSYRWPNPPTGEATIYAIVDEDDAGNQMYTEGNESNNLISITTMMCAPITESGFSGLVIDAVNGELLAGVEVELYSLSNGVRGEQLSTTITDGEGHYLFADLEAGDYLAVADLPGYIESSREVTLRRHQIPARRDLVVSPELDDGQVRIVLTWGLHPADLEAHLTVPNEFGCRHHCYYDNKEIPGAHLDFDHRDGYGPETITITEKAATRYRYYVHNFSNLQGQTDVLARSGATVTIYLPEREKVIFQVPFRPGNNIGNVWHVFDLDGTTDEIIPVQKLTSQESPGRIDYPVFTSPPTSHDTYLNQEYSFQVSATDPDDDPLLFSLENAPAGMTIHPESGLIEWVPTASQSGWHQEVTVKVDDSRCGEATQAHSFRVHSRPRIQFSVLPCSGFNPGGTIRLSWNTELADKVSIDQGIGDVPSSGSMTLPSPEVPTLYTLSAINSQMVQTRSVPDLPSAGFSFSPWSVFEGDSTTLTWNTSCAVEAGIDNSIGMVAPSGRRTFTPLRTDNTLYTLTMNNGAGSASRQASYLFRPPPAPPSPHGTLTISPRCNFTPGEPLILSWTSSNATSVSISPDIGEVDPAGSLEVRPLQAGSYELMVSNEHATRTITTAFPDYPSLSFNSSPSGRVDDNGTVRLSWSVNCADSVVIDQGIGAVEPSDSLSITPESLPLTYTLTAANERGERARSITVHEKPSVRPSGKIEADPTILKPGENTTLTWTSTLADSCTISPNIGEVDCRGSRTITPSNPTTYVLNMSGPTGTAASYTSVGYVRPVADLRVAQSTITEGESTTLRWICSNALSCTIDQGVGSVVRGEELVIRPSITTTYTMTATGPGGTARGSATVTVIPANPLPVVELKADRSLIFVGDSLTLSWIGSHVDALVISPEIGAVPASGSVTVSPEQTTTYTATATGPGGTATASLTITIYHPPPTITLNAVPTTIFEDQASLLSWSSENATRIIFNQGIGEVPLQGSLQVIPGSTTPYTATLTGPGGTTTRRVTVTVNHRSLLQLSIGSPLDGEVIATNQLVVSGQVSNNAQVTVNGLPAVVSDSTFSREITLDGQGLHHIIVQASDNFGQQAEEIIGVTLIYPPELEFSVDRDTLQPGESAILSWTTERATAVHIDQGIGAVTLSGSTTVSPMVDTTYTITATGQPGTTTAQVTVHVPQPEPTVILSAQPGEIVAGETSGLRWETEHADTCSLEPAIGAVDCQGEMIVAPMENTTFILTATGPGGSTSYQTTIIVAPPSQISLSITYPANGSVLSAKTTRVIGSVAHADSLETGVIVNGIPALVYGGQFIANHVPLRNGANTISVRATDGSGDIEQSISVTNTVPDRYVSLHSNTESGLAPMEATLQFRTNFNFAGVALLSYYGPAEVTFLSDSEPETWDVVINEPGLYQFDIEVQDEAGEVHTDFVTLLAMDRIALDTLLQGKWETMKSRLLENQIEDALDFFLEGSRSVYRNQFETMADKGLLFQIVNEMGAFRIVEHDGYGIIYDLRTERDGLEYSFQVLFRQDGNGIWKIKNY